MNTNLLTLAFGSTAMKADFSQITGEMLEFLVADLLRALRFAIVSPPGRGPDQGKDLIAERYSNDDLGITEKERCLVECKHLSGSNRSVLARDIGNFELRMKQHAANRYLLVTTTTVSETVKDQLLALTQDESGRKATYWALPDLVERLNDAPDIYGKYFHSWQSEADEAVTFVKNHLFPAHRGALLWCPGITAIFGNDGYTAPECMHQVEHLRKELASKGIEEIAFATDKDEYSWLILVRSGDASMLNDLIWHCSAIAKDHPAYEHERAEAFDRLYSYFQKPHKPVLPI